MSLNPISESPNQHTNLSSLTRLDFGSGPNPPNGFIGVDTFNGSDTDRVIHFDPTNGKRWPWPSESVDELRASHFIEHIRAENVFTSYGYPQDALFFFFSEAWRVAKEGALFTITWPAGGTSGGFQDPTHRRHLSLGFVDYLSEHGRELLRVTQYRVFCNWVIVDSKIEIGRVSPNHTIVDLTHTVTLRKVSSTSVQPGVGEGGELV